MENAQFTDIGDGARKQYIDARSAFSQFELSYKESAQVRGGMFWKSQGGREYLIRTSLANTQKSLGARSPETEEIFNKFIQSKLEIETRLTQAKASLVEHQRMNRAVFVGRAPQIVVDILNLLSENGFEEDFTVVGTHSLYAYEAAAGVRIIDNEALATQDIDLLWDTRKRISFLSRMNKIDASMIGLLKKIDPTFRIRPDQKYTAVNGRGFEVDIIRREVGDTNDPHPLQITGDEDDFWVAQARRAGYLLDSEPFDALIVSPSGYMARMHTVSPVAFAKFKRWMADQPTRDVLKKPRDILQATIVEAMVEQYFPQLIRKPPKP